MADDIIKAQNIVSGGLINISDKTFHNDSFIYKTSNERLSELVKYFLNKNDILTVIASGDLQLNCISQGVTNIDAFDISVFPKYFANLKIAAIKAIDEDEYIEFFFKAISTDDKYDDYYERIRKYLNNEDLVFWDGLFDYFDWFEIYNSLLFSHETFYEKNVIKENIYLQGNNYKELRKKLDSANINYYQGDIVDLSKKIKKEYDVIYLSNIIYYVLIKKYLKMINNFKLKENGMVLSYLYKGIKDKRVGAFQKFNDSEAGVLVYQKKY